MGMLSAGVTLNLLRNKICPHVCHIGGMGSQNLTDLLTDLFTFVRLLHPKEVVEEKFFHEMLVTYFAWHKP